MEKIEHSRDEIIQLLKQLEAEGKRPSRKLLELNGINGYWIQKLIPEGLSDLKEELGLEVTPQERPYSDNDLLIILDNVVTKLKYIPSWTQLRRETGISDKSFICRFGNKGILEVFTYYFKWLEENHPESSNIQLVNEYIENQGRKKLPRAELVKKGSNVPKSFWPKISGKEYGAPLYFGNMIYEPTNEQGVVFLFGMVSSILGFSIEHIGTEFPDCEAKRFIGGKRDRQQHVHIEFEYRSREFNHVIDECDIIVCWEDNWGATCPLEVIELRSKIQELRKLPEFSPK